MIPKPRIVPMLITPGIVLALAVSALAGGVPAGPSFPPPLESYGDGASAGVLDVLIHRIKMQPLNLWASLLFLGAVVHTFFTHRFHHIATVLEQRHREKQGEHGESSEESGTGCASARLFHFLGEVEAVFGIWVVPLMIMLAVSIGITPTLDYVEEGVNYHEALFVVVIMAISSTRPILRLVEQCMEVFARLGGRRPGAWWLSILTAGPLLGSFITEPAAMTISALLLGKKFYVYKPSRRFAYATLGLLFVNVSVGGTLTNFAAPPVLMVTAHWGWDTAFMVSRFGWIAVVGILACNTAYFLVFRKEFVALRPIPAESEAGEARGDRVPVWITVIHLLFMAAAVYNVHRPALLVGTFLFFLAFFEVTEDYQEPLQLRSPILVGFFLAGLVIHGGLQQWWIAPVMGRMDELSLMFGSVGLTAFNDNAAITYLATLVPNMTESMKCAVVAGAATGGGLTVIANAPNPAGQAILGEHFEDGISPLGLFLGALFPTVVMGVCFLLL
ncbi:MAG TPA: putative Na+/H+ antiporter [Geobacteraceae bacterium]|nr:putative Na+/H+ antiporter [Geobacteraceae bacterium]